MVEFFRSGQEKTEQGRVREEKLEHSKMKFTGTLIEDLMATVERAEQRAQSDRALAVEPLLAALFVDEALSVEAWFSSVQRNEDYDSKLIGVA